MNAFKENKLGDKISPHNGGKSCASNTVQNIRQKSRSVENYAMRKISRTMRKISSMREILRTFNMECQQCGFEWCPLLSNFVVY